MVAVSYTGQLRVAESHRCLLREALKVSRVLQVFSPLVGRSTFWWRESEMSLAPCLCCIWVAHGLLRSLLCCGSGLH